MHPRGRSHAPGTAQGIGNACPYLRPPYHRRRRRRRPLLHSHRRPRRVHRRLRHVHRRQLLHRRLRRAHRRLLPHRRLRHVHRRQLLHRRLRRAHRRLLPHLRPRRVHRRQLPHRRPRRVHRHRPALRQDLARKWRAAGSSAEEFMATQRTRWTPSGQILHVLLMRPRDRSRACGTARDTGNATRSTRAAADRNACTSTEIC